MDVAHDVDGEVGGVGEVLVAGRAAEVEDVIAVAVAA
jgi:hypothetical protein